MKTLQDYKIESLLEEYSEEVIALSQPLDILPDDITDDGNDIYSVGSQEYLVCDDYTANKYWDESLDSYLEDCVYPELSGNLANYFDDEKWKRDARMDGRGHSLNYYDGSEWVETINGTDYYIFRQN